MNYVFYIFPFVFSRLCYNLTSSLRFLKFLRRSNILKHLTHRKCQFGRIKRSSLISWTINIPRTSCRTHIRRSIFPLIISFLFLRQQQLFFAWKRPDLSPTSRHILHINSNFSLFLHSILCFEFIFCNYFYICCSSLIKYCFFRRTNWKRWWWFTTLKDLLWFLLVKGWVLSWWIMAWF